MRYALGAHHSLVMPGLVPGIHVFRASRKTWMAGTSPAMTVLSKRGLVAGAVAHFGESKPDTDERKIDPLMAKRKKPGPPLQLHNGQRWGETT